MNFTNQAQVTYNGRTSLSNVTQGRFVDALTATKTAVNDSYGVNDEITYIVSLVNTGSSELTGLTVTDNLVVETNTDNYLMMYSDGAYAPVTTVDDSEVTKELFDKKIIMPYTLQLLKSFGTDQDEEAVTNHSLVTFPESAELIPQESLGEDNTSAQIKAEKYPIDGIVYAKELFGESGETNVIVSGSYQFPAYAQFTQYANEAMVLEPMRAICSLGDTVVISGQSLTTPTLSYSVSEARAIEIIMIVIPVALIAVCLVVFLKRRHL